MKFIMDKFVELLNSDDEEISNCHLMGISGVII